MRTSCIHLATIGKWSGLLTFARHLKTACSTATARRRQRTINSVCVVPIQQICTPTLVSQRTSSPDVMGTEMEIVGPPPAPLLETLMPTKLPPPLSIGLILSVLTTARTCPHIGQSSSRLNGSSPNNQGIPDECCVQAPGQVEEPHVIPVACRSRGHTQVSALATVRTNCGVCTHATICACTNCWQMESPLDATKKFQTAHSACGRHNWTRSTYDVFMLGS